jgi:hypothetical protein
MLGAAALALAGCNGGSGAAAGSSTTTATVGANMAGPQLTVHISQQTIAAAPAPWALSTPQSTVRSYLDWTSYAYRIATSAVASPTMGADEFVRVDAYLQYNLEKSRLIDQTLTSISFGKTSVEGTHTLVPTKETWSYAYRSIALGNKVIGGSYTASYTVTYTLARSGKSWIVWSEVAKPAGTVK